MRGELDMGITGHFKTGPSEWMTPLSIWQTDLVGTEANCQNDSKNTRTMAR